MARPRKLTSEEMIRIVDAYYEGHGDPGKLKFSLIEEYAVSLGLNVDIKAYDFRRDASVRQRIDDLKNNGSQETVGAIAYKSLDVDALLNRNNTREALKNSLLEIDASWRLLYETAAALSKKNKALMIEALSQGEAIKAFSADNNALEARVRDLERGSNALMLENRYLKQALKKYLYPSIANEILKNEGSLVSADTEVMPEAMDALVETGGEPAPFSSAVSNDRKIMTREESLMERMGRKIHENRKATQQYNG